jgi:hypothetical protein
MFEAWEKVFPLTFLGEPGDKKFTVKDGEVIEVIVTSKVSAEPPNPKDVWKFGDHRNSDKATQVETVTKLLNLGHHWGSISKVVSITQIEYEMTSFEMAEKGSEKSSEFIKNPITKMNQFDNLSSISKPVQEEKKPVIPFIAPKDGILSPKGQWKLIICFFKL